MKRKSTLLPPTSQIAKLTEAQTTVVINALDKVNARDHSYAVAGLICGTVSFMAALNIFAYLIVRGHATAASSVLGTSVLAIIGYMIRARLRW